MIRAGHMPMAIVRRPLPFVLLLVGVALISLGLARALGITPYGVLVSIAAIGALLLTGGIWFGAPAPRTGVTSAAGDGSPILFDLQGRLVSGPDAGQPVTSRFPEAARLDVERHCVTVLAGHAARFPCVWEGTPIVFDGLPVRSADGVIVYGLLVPSGARNGVVATV
jgi:hypothetical protein